MLDCGCSQQNIPPQSVTDQLCAQRTSATASPSNLKVQLLEKTPTLD